MIARLLIVLCSAYLFLPAVPITSSSEQENLQLGSSTLSHQPFIEDALDRFPQDARGSSIENDGSASSGQSRPAVELAIRMRH